MGALNSDKILSNSPCNRGTISDCRVVGLLRHDERSTCTGVVAIVAVAVVLTVTVVEDVLGNAADWWLLLLLSL